MKFPCGVCMKGVRVNSILCLSCWNWVHKWCSGIKTSLRNCEEFICKTCSTTTGVVDPFRTCITIKRDEFEIFSEFCYLGDVIGQAGGCTDAVNAHTGSAWKAFHQLLTILTNKGISIVNHGRVFKACVRSVLLYGSETWPLSAEDLSQIKHSTEDLRRRIHVHYIEGVLRWNRLRLSDHLYRQEETSWIKKIMSFNVGGPTSRGRAKIKWKDVINADLHKKHLNIRLASDRSK